MYEIYILLRITSYNVCYTKLLRVGRAELLERADVGASVLKELINKNILSITEQAVDRLDLSEKEVAVAHPLSAIHRITSYNVCYTKLLRM